MTGSCGNNLRWRTCRRRLSRLRPAMRVAALAAVALTVAAVPPATRLQAAESRNVERVAGPSANGSSQVTWLAVIAVDAY